MRPIDPIIEDEEDEEDAAALQNEANPRQIGGFIKHEDFTENSMVDNEELINQYKNLPLLEQVFLTDHDFVCLQR
jgi:CRISPR/Cas system-associated protein Csx1